MFQVRALKGFQNSCVLSNSTIGTAMQRCGWPRMAHCHSNWRRWGSEQNNNSNNALAGSAMAVGLCETVSLTFKCSPTTDVFLFPSI